MLVDAEGSHRSHIVSPRLAVSQNNEQAFRVLMLSGGGSWGAAGLDVIDTGSRAAAGQHWMLLGPGSRADPQALAGRSDAATVGMTAPPPAPPGIVAPSGPRPRSSKKTSSFRGVAATDNGTWRARIRFGRYTVHLGRCVMGSMHLGGSAWKGGAS